jgi:hypothetical protein
MEISLSDSFCELRNRTPTQVNDDITCFSGESKHIYISVTNSGLTPLLNVKPRLSTIPVASSAPQCNHLLSDIFLIQFWNQLIKPTFSSSQLHLTYANVPELLLKHLQTTLPNGHWDGFRYIAPKLPIDISTDITPGETQYFLVKLDILHVAKLCKVRLKIDFTSRNTKIGNSELIITILPQALPKHNKIMGIYYIGNLVEDNYNYVQETQLRQQLNDISTHGFNTLAVKFQNLDSMTELFKISKELGFSNKFLLIDNIQKDSKQVSTAVKTLSVLGGDIFLRGVDEPNKPIKFNRHLRISQDYHLAGYRVWTSIRTDVAIQLNGIEPLDWANCHYDELFFKHIRNCCSTISGIKTYYWQMYMEEPVLNRYLSGIFLYYSKSDGILPFVYRYAFKNDSPWSSDLSGHNEEIVTSKRYKCFYTTYPSDDGPISTLQWEAFIDGNQDLRYCLLVEDMISDLQKNGHGDTAESISKEFQRRLDQICAFFPANNLKVYQSYELELSNSISEFRHWVLKTWQKYCQISVVK